MKGEERRKGGSAPHQTGSNKSRKKVSALCRPEGGAVEQARPPADQSSLILNQFNLSLMTLNVKNYLYIPAPTKRFYSSKLERWIVTKYIYLSN